MCWHYCENCEKEGIIIKNNIKASLTVELAMVFPIVIYTIISIVYAGFYLHDHLMIRSVLQSKIYDYEEYVKYPMDEEQSIIDFSNINARGIFASLTYDYEKENTLCSTSLKKKLEGKPFITQIGNTSVCLTHSKVSIELECTVNVPFHAVRLLLGEDRLHYTEKVKEEVFRPCDYVRLVDLLIDTSAHTNAGDKVLAALQKVVGGE